MTRVERSIIIDRPVEEVFAFTHDLSNNALWQTTLVEIEPLFEGPIREGAQWREVRRFIGKRIETVLELTEYEPTTGSAVKLVSGPVPLSGTYGFEAVNGGTRFTVTGELDAHGFFRLAEPVFSRITARELESNLGHLKDLLEAGASS
jgi:uncharacterized membrane protein